MAHGNKDSRNVGEVEREDLDTEILRFVEKYIDSEVEKKIKAHQTSGLARIRGVLRKKRSNALQMQPG